MLQAGIDGRHVAAHGGLAGNEAADRLADAGRRRWMVPERAAAFISCASSIPPQPEAPFFTLADRIFWQEVKDEVHPLLPFRPGRQALEVVELIFGSANVRTLLLAERSAASRACPPAMTKRRVDLADQLHQAGISIVGIQETRCRRQVEGLCRGFGVFAAAADQAGGVELWIRQDILGDPADIHHQIPRYSAGASFLMQGLPT